MKKLKTSMILILIILLYNCSNQQKKENEFQNSIKKITFNQTENQLNEYLSETYEKFNDSINDTSGLLGWKNARDYFSLGKENMREKSSRIWYSVYDSLYVTNIVKLNLEEAYISLGKNPNNIKVNYISGKEQIGLYTHKVGLSIIANVFEYILEYIAEFIGSVLIGSIIVIGYIAYMFTRGGWIRWSKKRHEKIDTIQETAIKWGGYLGLFVIVATMFFKGDLTKNQVKNKIKNDILKEIKTEIKINLQ